MKRKALFYVMMALAMLMGAQEARAQYDVSDLTSAGWTKVTSTAGITDGNFYVIWDETNNLMVGLNASNSNIYYQTPANPHANSNVNKVWAIEAHDSYHNFRNLANTKLLAQIEWNAGYNLHLNDQPNPNEWSDLRLAYALGVWTIEDARYSVSTTGTDGTQYSDTNVDASPYPGYWGPWTAGDFTDGIRIAGNKSTSNRGSFSIYAISRADYLSNYLAVNATPADISFYVAGLTNSTSKWVNDFTNFSRNYQAQRRDNKDTNEYKNWGYLEAWNNGVTFTGTLTTTLTGLPDGMYDIGAYCFKNTTDNVDFTVNSSSVALGNANDKYQYMSFSDVEVSAMGADANKATVGLNITGGTWLGITDVRLLYKGPVSTPMTAGGGAATADVWYAIPVAEAGRYHIESTATGEISYTQAGTTTSPSLSSAVTDYISPSSPVMVELEAGTLFVRSSVGATITLTYVAGPTQVDVTSLFMLNDDFSQTTARTTNVVDGNGYVNNTEANNIDGWVGNASGWHGSAVFQYGSGRTLPNGTVPAFGPNGSSDGQCLALCAAWSGGTMYYGQNVTLPAGTYKLRFYVYNGGAATAETTNIGWYVDGVATYSFETPVTTGAWQTLETEEFTVDSETQGQIRLGYAATGNTPVASHAALFFDKVQIICTKYIT